MTFHKTRSGTSLAIGIKVNTTTATIHVTFVQVSLGHTDVSAIHGNLCVLVHMAVLTSTEHTTFDCCVCA